MKKKKKSANFLKVKLPEKTNYKRTVINLQPFAIGLSLFATFCVLIAVIMFIDKTAFPEIRHFFGYTIWHPSEIKQSTMSSYPDEKGTTPVETIPPAEKIEATRSVTEVQSIVETKIAEMKAQNFWPPLVEKLYTEALKELEKGDSVAARQKLLLTYQMAQEMQAAYINKQNRYQQSTGSATQ